jgi:hypothetical protein
MTRALRSTIHRRRIGKPAAAIVLAVLAIAGCERGSRLVVLDAGDRERGQDREAREKEVLARFVAEARAKAKGPENCATCGKDDLCARDWTGSHECYKKCRRDSDCGAKLVCNCETGYLWPGSVDGGVANGNDGGLALAECTSDENGIRKGPCVVRVRYEYLPCDVCMERVIAGY